MTSAALERHDPAAGIMLANGLARPRQADAENPQRQMDGPISVIDAHNRVPDFKLRRSVHKPTISHHRPQSSARREGRSRKLMISSISPRQAFGRSPFVAASHSQKPTCGGGFEARSARKRQRRCEAVPCTGIHNKAAKIGNCHTFFTPVEC